MSDRQSRERRAKRPPKPLDSARLQELALAYVARFSTTKAKLETYLKRKLRERGWDGEAEPDVEAISARYVDLGYIDDAIYAKTKAGGLLGRGYGPRRVSDALYAAGISEDIRENLAPGELGKREAARVMARKRRFGPYFSGELETDRREKQISAMLRAGHGFDAAKAVINALSSDAIDQWVDEVRDDNGYE
ncbi:MAG: RecX family transcriptional regulator [Pontixanthobacter sp.]